MAKTEVRVRITDTEEFKAFLVRVEEFVREYAWHTRECASIDADGEWHLVNAACTCGYDEAREALAVRG